MPDDRARPRNTPTEAQSVACVTASSDHDVADHRRIDLIEAGLPVAPIHHEGGAHPG
jgi:hypothetical protein